MKIEQQRRLDTNNLDTVKAFLTLSVLLYHSILAWSAFGWHSFTVKPFPFFAYLADLLLKFHTPAFTFLSGYLFYFLRYEKGKYRNPAKDIAGRAKRLLLPYGVMLLWVIPFYMTVENGTWNTAFIKYILAVSPTQLWYLIMLFGVFAVFYLLSDRLCKYPVVNFAVFYVIYGVATVLALVIPDYFQCWTVMKSLLYFYFGYAVRQDVFHKQSKFAHNIYIYIRLRVLHPDFFGLPVFADGRIVAGKGLLCYAGSDHYDDRHFRVCGIVCPAGRKLPYKDKAFPLYPAL